MADRISEILRNQKSEREIDRLTRMARYVKLSKNKVVQRQWKKYKQLTMPNARVSKEQWYDLHYSNTPVKEPRIGELYM